MHLALTETQSMIRDTIRDIAKERIAPIAEKLDRHVGHKHYLENLKFLGEQGFVGLNVKSEYGGAEADTISFALVIEELGYACASTAVAISINNMVAEVIQAVGSEEQKREALPRLCAGASGAFCLTEAGAGSDPAGLQTRAEKVDGGYTLNGSKIYITNGSFADYFVVWAVTDPSAPKGKGISLFLIPVEGTTGISVTKSEEKMGQHGSPTNTINFDDCFIPNSCLMGAENSGFRTAMGELAGGRIGIAALSLGIARAAMDAAKAHMLERKQFGQRLWDMQGLQWMVADRETEIEAARLLIMQACWLKDQHQPFAKAASMAKLYASEMAGRATDTAIQLMGGAGYIKDYPLERYARDARITRIYEGTSEIQRLIIAREVLREIGG